MSGTTPSGNNNGNNNQHNNSGNDAQQQQQGGGHMSSRPPHMHPGQHLESIGNGGIKTDDSSAHHQYGGAQQQGGHSLMMPAMNTPGLSEEDSEDHSQADKTAERKPGRRKINIEFIEDKSRRHITFSKRKAGIMKKAYELSALTGTQVLLLVASETGHVYTFATPKLQPLITKPEGKNLIQTCLNAPDIPQMPTGGQPVNTSQRRNTGGFPDAPYPEPEMGGMGSYGGTGAGGYMHQNQSMRQYSAPNSSAPGPINSRFGSQQESPMAPGGAGGYGGYGGQAAVGVGGAAGAGGPGGYPQNIEQDYAIMSGQYGSGWHGNPGPGQHMAHMHPQHQSQTGKMSTEAQLQQLQQLNNTSLSS